MNNALLIAALSWFRDHRPIGWSVEKHCDQPCVGLRGQSEFDLAIAIAEYLKTRSNKELNKKDD